MDFTTQTKTIQKTVKKLSKKAYKYGVCSTKNDWSITKLTPDEIWIDIDGLLQDGEPSPNIKITNNPKDKAYPYHILLSDVKEYCLDTRNGYIELATPEITNPFTSIKEALEQAGSFIINNEL